MADDDKILLSLDLDDSGFTDTLAAAQKQITAFGSGDSIKGLVEGFLSLKGGIADLGSSDSLVDLTKSLLDTGAAVATLGTAAFALKTAFDMTMEGEQIEAVSKQFDLLTANAGLSGKTLKSAFLAATGGLLTDTQALQLANSAIIRMGQSASNIPQIMELARKSTQVMGGNLAQNFQNMVQAIESGNKKMLRRVGISVDVNKAEKDFADSIGKSVNSLSEAGKAQAILNAVLDQSKGKFGGISGEIKQSATLLQQFKVTAQEVGEALAVIFNKTLSKPLQSVLSGLTTLAKYVKNEINEMFGEGDAKIDAVQAKIDLLQKQRAMYAAQAAQMPDSKDAQRNVQRIDDEIARLRGNLQGLKKDQDAIAKPTGSPGAVAEAKAEANPADLEKEKQEYAKFQKDLESLRAAREKNEASMVQTSEQLAKSEAAQRLNMANQLNAKLLAIDSNADLSKAQKEQLKAEENKNYTVEVEKFEQGSYQRREQMLDNYAAHSKGVFDGMARAAKSGSQKAALDLEQGSKLGQQAFQTMGSGIGKTFEQMGAGAAGGTANVKQAFFGMIGSVAAEYGSFMILSSLWPFNPPVFAAGVALEVLAGALGAAGGSSTSSMPSSASSTTPVLDTTSAASSPSTSSATTAGTKSSVNINIQGSVFDSPTTGTRIVDLIRQASDSTDYAYVQVGNKPYGSQV